MTHGDPPREIPEGARALLAGYQPSDEDAERLDDLIVFLEDTMPEDWCVDVVRTEGTARGQNCVFGHIFNWGQACGDGSDEDGSHAWDWFEGVWSTTYATYPVNDGKVARYQEPTARERSLAYLRELRSGAVPSTMESMMWDFYSGDIDKVREGESRTGASHSQQKASS